MTSLWVEVVGYVASALVVVSLTRARVLHLRILSLAGSTTFMVYGILIGSAPIVITNVAIVGINVWHLWKITTFREDFSLLELSPESAYLSRFLEFHGDEIGAIQPGFAGVDDDDIAFLVLRDMVPAALVVGHPDDGELRVSLDYAIPAYRDFKMGRWLYDHRPDVFDRLGVETVVARGRTDAHRRYLTRSGFEAVPGSDRWVRSVGSGR